MQHHGVLSLTLLTLIRILNLLGAFLRLDAIILGEGALVTSSAGVSQEMRTDRLNAALHAAGQLSDSLEVLLGAPSFGKDGQRQVIDLRNGSHCDVVLRGWQEASGSRLWI